MRIISMTLENFQGVKHFEMSPNGADVSVYGDNGTGKTTIYNAFCFLMYGKPSTGEKSYSPLTYGMHGLNHVAEMTIDVNGNALTLKKDYHETYKGRGSKKELTGYTVDHYINGVPVAEKDYKAKVSEICRSDEIAKILTRYNYFLEDMKITERRQLLLDVCGSDIFVPTNYPELDDLPKYLQNHSIDEYIEIAKAKKKKLDAEQKAVRPRIDEAEKAKPEAPELGKAMIEGEIRSKELAKKSLEAKLAAADGTAEADTLKAIAEAEAELAKIRAGYVAAHAELMKVYATKRDALMERKAKNQAKATELESQAEYASRRVGSMTTERNEIIKEMYRVNDETWSGAVCPTCGRELPEDQVKEKKKAFNLRKSERQEELRAKGQNVSKDKIEDLKLEVKQLEDRKKTLLEKVIPDIEAEIKALKEPEPIEDGEDAKALTEKIEALKKDLGGSGQSPEKSGIEERIKNLDGELEKLRKDLASIEMIEKQTARINEIKEKEEENAAMLEDIDAGLALCKLYGQRKAEALTDSINNHFETLKFRLFKPLVNGDVEDDCEALVNCNGDLAPFKSANNASRINAGLEIIDALGEWYGFKPPIYIDNCESVTKPRQTKAQQIRLYVSEADKALRCEYAE